MRPSPRAVLVIVAAGTFAPLEARADDVPWIVKEAPHPDAAALQINPLGVAVGRFSATVELVLTTHHALVATPHYDYAFPASGDAFNGGGAELGYRYYTGRRGTDGFFLGASLSYGSYSFARTVPTAYGPTGAIIDGPYEKDFASYGGAVDAGYKAFVWGGFVVGVGAGLRYEYHDEAVAFTPRTNEELLYGSGLRPRILLEAGGAF